MPKRKAPPTSSRDLTPQRDLIGYGQHPPVFNWPNGALLAVNFAINIEEGSEPSIPDGDGSSTAALCECPSDAPPGVRDLAAENMFEFGSQVGVWRVLRAFKSRGIPATAFACALALEKLPELAAVVKQEIGNGGLDLCCHGYRWEDHIAMDEDSERERIETAVKSLTATLGAPPPAWYCRTAPSVNTRRLLVEHGGFTYDSDAYNGELPYWTKVEKSDGSVVDHLVLPYTLCTNDSKFAPGRAFSTADDFYNFCRTAVDELLEEAQETGCARMLSIGLHPRLIGHAPRIAGLKRLLDYLKGLGPQNVWLATRLGIAEAFKERFPPPNAGVAPLSVAPVTTGPMLLITGGAGFVLSHVARTWLQTHPDGSCVLFDRLPPSRLLLLEDKSTEEGRFFKPLIASGRLKFFCGDVGDESSWARLATTHGLRFTHVVAGAAVTPTPEEEARLGLEIARINFFGVLRAFEFARRCKPALKRFLLVSSDAVYSAPSIGGVAHSSPATPAVASYALSKLAAEAQIQRWREVYPDVDSVAVRFSDVYGPMDRDTGARNRHNAPYWVVNRALKGETIVIEADGSLVCLEGLGWDYIDAGSAARGVVTLLDAPNKPKRFLYELGLGRCVAHGELIAAILGVSFEDMCDDERHFQTFESMYARIEFADARGEWTPAPNPDWPHVVRPLADDHWLRTHPMDAAAMKEEFGWEATPLAEAVKEYVEWVKGGELTSVAASEALPPPMPSAEAVTTTTTNGVPQVLAGLSMVVTGGASGIGKGIVLHAASKGCAVVYLDLRDTPLEGGMTTSEAAKGLPGRVVFLPGDVTKKADHERAARKAIELTGRLDIWVNNAALDLTDPPHNKSQKLLDVEEDQFDAVMGVNVKGYLLGAKAAVATFLKQERREATGLRGKVIFIASQHGMVACPGNVPYGVSKAAAAQMMRIIAVDYANDFITCNAVAPGKIVKDPNRPVAQYSYDRTPCPVLGKPSDIAAAVCHLAGDECGQYKTGAVEMVDGGWMAF